MRSRQYTADRIPFVTDIRSYYDNWVLWWSSCQPAWRRNDGWPLPRDGDGATGADWGKVGARGQAGLFIVVMSTTWWAASIRSEEEWASFDDAVDDLHWVIEQVIAHLKTIPAPLPPPETSKKPPPSSGVAWMSRTEGKRQARPSRRLLEASGA